MVLTYFVRFQAWAPMARHGNWSLILELEGVQRSFTRMIDGVGLLTYRDRLDKLKLTTLLERRVCGDLIEMFKIQEGFVSYGSELVKEIFSKRNFIFNCNFIQYNSIKIINTNSNPYICQTSTA